MPQLNRNEPCHCGSGKKYKKCHIEKDEKSDQKKRQKAAVNAANLSLKEGTTNGKKEKKGWFNQVRDNRNIFKIVAKRKDPARNKVG